MVITIWSFFGAFWAVLGTLLKNAKYKIVVPLIDLNPSVDI